MKVLILGDMHLKVSNLENGKRFLHWVDEVVAEHNPSMVINLGDAMDTHAILRAEVLSEYGQHVQRICNRPIPDQGSPTIYVHVLGNHEFYKPNSSEYHALQSLKGLSDHYYVADTDDAVKMWGFSFIPYHPDPSTFPTEVGEICFAHQTFIGADFGNFRPDLGVDMEQVKADIIISGHIHKGQTVGKVFYPGSPFSQCVDDVDQVKGVYIFDTKTYDKQFIPCPLPRWRSYTAAYVDEHGKLSLDNIHVELESTLTPNDYWIVNLSGPRTELTAYLNSKKFVDLRSQFSIRVRVKHTDNGKDRVQIRAVTAQDAICQYVDKVYDGDIDHELLKKRALAMLGINPN